MLEVSKVAAVDPVHSNVVRHPVHHHTTLETTLDSWSLSFVLSLSTSNNCRDWNIGQSPPSTLNWVRVAVFRHQNKITTNSVVIVITDDIISFLKNNQLTLLVNYSRVTKALLNRKHKLSKIVWKKLPTSPPSPLLIDKLYPLNWFLTRVIFIDGVVEAQAPASYDLSQCLAA